MLWFGEEFEQKDVPLDFEGDLPLKGITIDGNEYYICLDTLCGGWRVWVDAQDDDGEYTECVFRGSKNECKNYVYWNMEVIE